MPRKEKLPLEERLEQAKEFFTRKQEEKFKHIAELEVSKIYKLARRSSIAFLWIAQLVFIDWILPYKEVGDRIKDGYQVKEANSNGYAFKEGYLTITTQKNKKLELLLNKESVIPDINDSIFVLKSMLLHEVKKIKDLNKNETYLISSSLTYVLLPLIILPALLSLLFLFIKNIEVKAFFYFVFIVNSVSVVVLLSYYVLVN